jgi:formylglycine-generating enzyme required for sulfatase activity
MADVFISYSKTRSAEAAELAGELGELGYHVWWDTRLLPTGSFGTMIDRELNVAKAVVVIWSPESVRSKWVRSEAEHGDRQDKLVNTHTAEINDPGSQIPKPFNQTHSVGMDNIRAIVAALDALNVPRSGSKGTPTPVIAPVDSVADADDRLFGEVEKAHTADAYEYYLAELPEGRHASVAKFRLYALRSAVPHHQHEKGHAAGEQEAQAAENRAKLQTWSLARPALVAGAFVAVGVVLVSVRLLRSPQPVEPPPAVTQRTVTQPTATQPTVAEVSGPVPLSSQCEEALKPRDIFKECATCPEMVVVPNGSFTMGSPASEKGRDANEVQHRVTFARPFAVGRFAVTFDEWDACAADGGCRGRAPGDELWGRGRRPVINVSWDDAKAYVNWLSHKTNKPYRLLSEAEREYVTRAETTTPFWWGNTIATSQANYDGNFTYGGGARGEYRRQTLPVDSFEPNSWGLFQVHGNVWDWMEDCWNGTYNNAPADGSAWTTGNCTLRVIRGGSWSHSPSSLRSAKRDSASADIRVNSFGFRVARTLTR